MLDMMPCPSCEGAKLRKESLAVHISLDKRASKSTKNASKALPELINIADLSDTYNIHDLQSLPIADLVAVMEKFSKTTSKNADLARRIV